MRLSRGHSLCVSKLGKALNTPPSGVNTKRVLQVVASCQRKLLGDNSIEARAYAEGQERAIVALAHVTPHRHDFISSLERIPDGDAKLLFQLAAAKMLSSLKKGSLAGSAAGVRDESRQRIIGPAPERCGGTQTGPPTKKWRVQRRFLVNRVSISPPQWWDASVSPLSPRKPHALRRRLDERCAW
ncbi:hypothetical protein B0T16DRAFT_232854 [Cercophora newfieldiana]|uniref:Uncharacterized protein n=1 Tax=Cercophora newfieldiana TaxID=92897 RepID=A0AA39XTJ4_9PEZI|nr:hypothetical protein B0T16DRAFT_232854 [Cercophora newfieldiana]